LLMRPEVDVWKPGQHTGTFRGNQLGFVAATAALEHWRDPAFAAGIAERGRIVEKCLRERIATLAPDIEVRGQGLLWGLDVSRVGGRGPEVAKAIGTRAFEQGLIIERCGRDDTVLKVMPPLNVDLEHLAEGCGILARAASDVLGSASAAKRAG
jgi:diaminobutyrate-2-oxoglutarate transaminase